MTRALTLVETTRDLTYGLLKHPPRRRFGHHSCPQFLDKQMKFVISSIHKDVLEAILSKFQEVMRTLKRKAFWAPWFISMAVLAAAVETLEASVRLQEQVDRNEGLMFGDNNTAGETIAAMDDRFNTLSALFHQTYRTLLPGGLNPICDLRDDLDDASQSLALQASEIIRQHRKAFLTVRNFTQCLTGRIDEFLIARRDLPPPTTTSDPHTGRLLARFLLMFFPPQKEDHQHPSHGSSGTA